MSDELNHGVYEDCGCASCEALRQPKTCEAGCTVFDGGERRHDKNCAFYSGSFTEMFDHREARIEELETQFKEVARNTLEASKELHKEQLAKARNGALEEAVTLSRAGWAGADMVLKLRALKSA